MAIQRARRVVEEDEYDRMEQYDRLVDLFDREPGDPKDRDSEELEGDADEEDE